MRNRQIGWMFTSIMLLHILVILLLSFLGSGAGLSLPMNFFLSEGVLALPTLVFLLATGGKDGRRMSERLGLHKIKWSSAVMLALYALLLLPLATLVNAISMLFVENRIGSMSGEMLGLSFPVLFFFSAVNAPFWEELVFRGAVYQSCRANSGSGRAILFSSLLFALMHLNFNQASYAFVLGVAFALAVEATGSLWGGLLIHFVFNGINSIELFALNLVLPQAYGESVAQTSLGGLEMQVVIGVYLVIATVTTALAGCVLAWIAKNEGRQKQMRRIRARRKKAPRSSEQGAYEKIWSVPVVLGIVIALGYMVFDAVLF